MFNSETAIEAFLNSGIDYLIHVPATGMTSIYDFFENRNSCINVSREEEGIALAAGISLAGKLPLVFIQQSGVGNMLNAFIGLADGYDIYFPILVLDRGINDENPIQAHSSFRTIPLIKTFEEPFIIDFTKKESINMFKILINKRQRWFISSY